MRRIAARSAVAALGLAVAPFVAGAAPSAAGQDADAFVFRRICNLRPGQDAAAAALAREMVALVERRYPGVEMEVQTGRWMTGAQNIERPVDQMLFSERHPDPEMRRDFTEILMGDAEFRALQLEIPRIVDVATCVETRFRERR